MNRTKEALDLLFGIGFRIGFVMALLGLMMMYMPLMVRAVYPFLEVIGFWEALRKSPQMVTVIGTGLTLMVGAFCINVVRKWVGQMIDILFSEELGQAPKSSE